MQIFLWNIMSEQSQSLLFTCFSIFIHTWFPFWPSLKHKCCLRRDAVIRGFIHPSVGPSVRWSVVIELKSGKTSVFDTFCVCLCVCRGEWGFGCGLGLDAPAHPSATILWPRVTCLFCQSFGWWWISFKDITWDLVPNYYPLYSRLWYAM